MPICGCQVINCDVPIRLDSYRGCSFSCGYCLERLKRTGKCEPIIEEGIYALKNFIDGKRTLTTNWCDWQIPLHWGGISDPFQPAERSYGQSLKMLRIFADTYYPVVLSTKSTLILHRNYLDLLSHCNICIQISLCSPSEPYTTWERRAPSFRHRLKMLWKLAPKVKRIIVRIQPYMPEIYEDVLKLLPVYAASGVHGITIEGLKWPQQWGQLTVRFGSNMVYPDPDLWSDYMDIRDACHDAGLRFYCAENRMRHLGDSPTCCGCDMDGFDVNTANMNYNPVEYRDQMKKPGTATAFASVKMTAAGNKFYAGISYRDAMELRVGR